MKNNSKFYRISKCLIILLLFSSTIFSQKQSNVVAGKGLQVGVGQFADPTVFHGLTVGLQAGMGASDKSSTFGLDGLTANLRWTPGTNEVGRRISILFGVADWYTPAPSSVYPKEVLTQPEQDSGSNTINAGMLGLSFLLFGNRMSNNKIWDANQAKLEQLDLNIKKEQSPAVRERLIKEKDSFVWTDIIRPISREPSAIIGGLFRLGSISTISNVNLYDLFFACASGRGLFDFAISGHYLKYLSNELIPKDAGTISLGAFLDLSDNPPPPVLGVSASYGYYRFQKKTLVMANDTSIASPNINRIDFILSISGAPDNSGGTSAGLGIKYSHLWNSDIGEENQLALVFSTNFKFAK